MAARPLVVLLLALSVAALAVPLAGSLEGLRDPVASVEALAADDECTAGSDSSSCALSALQLRARELATPRPKTQGPAATVASPGDAVKADACLCVFDVDRTLTSKQGGVCPGTAVVPGVEDTAYGGGAFTPSAVGSALASTFCGTCYLGIVSMGDASGQHSKERQYLVSKVLVSGPQRTLDGLSPTSREWTVGPIAPGGSVSSPLVVKQPDGSKQHAVKAIVNWYAQLGVKIPLSQVHFYDDRRVNIASFVGHGINARQISCKTRDFHLGDGSEVGLCGASLEELVPNPSGQPTVFCA